jgi:hypothetical protein
MKIALIIFAITVSIAGCDNSAFDNSIKKAVREKLKDPDSAKFKEELVIRTRACISVNAKNSYGGYSGETIAHLKNYGTDNWSVETLEGDPCYPDELEGKLAIDKANEEAEKALLEKLKAKKLIGATVQDVYSIEDKRCQDFASDLMTSIRLANEASNEEDKKSWQAQANEKMVVIDSGACK